GTDLPTFGKLVGELNKDKDDLELKRLRW
ncbi:unnamed protein product, partial [Tilletia controversa]